MYHYSFSIHSYSLSGISISYFLCWRYNLTLLIMVATINSSSILCTLFTISFPYKVNISYTDFVTINEESNQLSNGMLKIFSTEDIPSLKSFIKKWHSNRRNTVVSWRGEKVFYMVKIVGITFQ